MMAVSFPPTHKEEDGEVGSFLSLALKFGNHTPTPCSLIPKSSEVSGGLQEKQNDGQDRPKSMSCILVDVGSLGCFVKAQIPSSCINDPNSASLRQSPEGCILNNTTADKNFSLKTMPLGNVNLPCGQFNSRQQVGEVSHCTKFCRDTCRAGPTVAGSAPPVAVPPGPREKLLRVALLSSPLDAEKTLLCPSSEAGGRILSQSEKPFFLPDSGAGRSYCATSGTIFGVLFFRTSKKVVLTLYGGTIADWISLHGGL